MSVGEVDVFRDHRVESRVHVQHGDRKRGAVAVGGRYGGMSIVVVRRHAQETSAVVRPGVPKYQVHERLRETAEDRKILIQLQTSDVHALKSDSFDHLLYFTPAVRPTFRGQCGYLTPTGLNVYVLRPSCIGLCHVI